MTKNLTNKELENFTKFLVSAGAEVLINTNPYEVIRFRANDIVSIIYTSKKGYTFTNEAKPAFNKFKQRPSNWKVKNKPRRRALTIQKRTLIERDGDTCFYCGKILSEEEMTVEHLLSRTHGGTTHLSNLVLAHSKCNQAASCLSLIEKIKFREMLRGAKNENK